MAFSSPLLENSQLISFSTHCVSLCHPQISVLSVDVSLSFHVSCSLPPSPCFIVWRFACFLLSVSFLICHYLPSLSQSLFSLSLSLCQPVCLFPVYPSLTFSISVFFLFFISFSSIASSQPRQVYCSGLLSVSKALDMNYWSDWPLAAQLMFGCGVFSLIPFQFFKCFWLCMSLRVFEQYKRFGCGLSNTNCTYFCFINISQNDHQYFSNRNLTASIILCGCADVRVGFSWKKDTFTKITNYFQHEMNLLFYILSSDKTQIFP